MKKIGDFLSELASEIRRDFVPDFGKIKNDLAEWLAARRKERAKADIRTTDGMIALVDDIFCASKGSPVSRLSAISKLSRFDQNIEWEMIFDKHSASYAICEEESEGASDENKTTE